MSIQVLFRRALALGAVAAMLVSCSRGSHEASETNASNTNGTNSMNNSSAPPGTPAPATTALSDANIAQIVMSANDGDIDNARYALRKTKNDAVKAFANQMITDHESLNKQAKDLTSRLNLKPEANDTSKQLEDKAEATRKGYDDKKDAVFDRAYIDDEVMMHQSVLDMLDKTLIPGASNADLKSLLEKARPTIQAHLDHAKHVQSSLPNGT